MTGLITPKIERRRLSPVGKSLVKLGEDKSLKDGPFQGMGKDVLRIPNPQKEAQEAGIEKIDLGALDNSFREIRKMGGEEMDDKPGLEDRDPLPGGRVGNGGIGGQRGEVEQLPASSGAKSDESLKDFQVADVGHFPDVPFDVGPVVGGEPVLGLQVFVVNPRV